MLPDLPHGFSTSEFEGRVSRAQSLMRDQQLDGLLLSAMDNIRYFLGVNSTFWESYTRPWFVLMPARGEPIAIIPEIGRSFIEQSWVKQIRSWPSPRPEDEGTSLVVSAISDLPRQYGRVAAELGTELRLGMTVLQLHAIMEGLSSVEIVDGSSLLWRLRMVKSQAEVAKIKRAIDIAGAVYAEVPDFVRIGDSERRIHQQFRSRVAQHGADSIPMLVCRSETGGPNEITGGPRDRMIADGDLLFIDTGTTFDGYFCDYDRNYQVGHATDALLFAQEKVWEANEVGLKAVRPGIQVGQVYQAMAKFLSSDGEDLNSNGRMGHGLGLRLTEPPSVRLEDETILQPGMVLCVEPALEYEPGKIVLHEETVLITDDGAQILTSRAPKQLPKIF
ncbi:MAG: aminopeptidase P family protein [Mesorhizobium sp.]|uniref:M24 family metallopeptidase n=1 Tax=Mesorhizobium sp. TaxID=1871066 RepID=UPI000FE4B17C|nr:Xaa-Pro peptidase family protein [Mesorhizobium sp.]RWE20822.1 MAG: aminopeptidase P family protein [Mesorhizobium sp.]